MRRCLSKWKTISVLNNSLEIMNSILLWATVLSPIVGVIAIIVALIIAHRSSKETKQQINAVYKLLDVFVAAQNPTMMEAKKKYELQLAELDKQIHDLKEDIQFLSPFFGRGPLVEDMDELFKKDEQCKQLEVLESKRAEMQEYLDLIQSYLSKTKH